MRLPAGGVGHVSYRVFLFARYWRRAIYGVVLLFVKIATAAAALVRVFFVLFVVIDWFIAALAACLCGWLVCSARHGTADIDDGHGAADVRLGARSACVRV